ncbi:RNA polymerase sigma factor [Arundinibacter roseus]|uniref:Sigma-70 family RNA polymerase sigma factor n=1 Tax=Arundinibacter roseus TaxID=2070510 RepID=A0A4R4KI41_9BACT|nr:sigma-70 family RNA polymerase sigma factor [Arundinibacter roseus]TDB67553.1 sigma-70 family RNA polymerase sigma factor [Arundinibacter roseus]
MHVDLTQEHPTDQHLWDSFQQGDEKAFATMYQLHYRALYGYGKKFGLDESLVEDAIQDLFINLWRSKNNLTSVSNIKYYLFRCLRRDLHRQHIRETRMDSLDSREIQHTLSHPFEELTFEQDENERELAAKLVAVLRKLPKRQFEAITLRYYENFSTKEIASIMEVSEKTVRNTLYNALLHLRESVPFFTPFLKIGISIFLASK